MITSSYTPRAGSLNDQVLSLLKSTPGRQYDQRAVAAALHHRTVRKAHDALQALSCRWKLIKSKNYGTGWFFWYEPPPTMEAAAPKPQPAAIPAPEVPAGAADQVVWLQSLLPVGRPRRVARMYASGQNKYRDLDRDDVLPASWLADHVAGHATWASTLDLNDLTRLAAADIDEPTPDSGRAALLAAYTTIRAAGLQAFAIHVSNPKDNHYGGHIFGTYADMVNAAHATAHWRTLLPHVKEIWPCKQVIRLLLGFHQRAHTFGELWYLSDAGELQIFDQDDADQRAAAIELVMSLPMNPAPPEPSQPGKLDQPRPEPVQIERKISCGKPVDSDLPLVERYRLAREHIREHYNLVAELEDAGAVQTRDGYSCPFCKHTHETTLTIADGGKAGFSHSPRCVLYNERRGFDVTNVLMVSGNYASFDKLARALAPHCFSQSRSKADRQDQPRRQQTPAQKADAERKRAARQRQAGELRADVEARAVNDIDMPECARRQLDIHLMVAGQRGWHRASIARQADLAGYSERWTQIANRYLVEHGYLTREQDDPTQTARWTFVKSAAQSSRKPQPTDHRVISEDCENKNGSPVYIYSKDLYTNVDLACEGGAHPDGDPRSDNGDLEGVAAFGSAALTSNNHAESDYTANRELLTRVRNLARQANEAGWFLRDYADWPAADLTAECDRLVVLLAGQPSTFDDASEPEVASYDPNADWTLQASIAQHFAIEAAMPAPEVRPGTLSAGIRMAIEAIERKAEDEESGEQWRYRATPDRVRAWLAARWPDMDTTTIEEIYPDVRKQLQDERTARQAKVDWSTERARVHSLDNGQLLSELAAWQAKQKYAKKAAWSKKCAAMIEIYDKERRSRGLLLEDQPRQGRLRKSGAGQRTDDAPGVWRAAVGAPSQAQPTLRPPLALGVQMALFGGYD